MLHSFFWAIPRRLNFTVFLFTWPMNMEQVVPKFRHVHTTYEDGTECSKTSARSHDLRRWNKVFQNIGTFTRPMKMEQGVPKRRHIKFKRRGITQKKGYNKHEDGGRNFWARSGYKSKKRQLLRDLLSCCRATDVRQSAYRLYFTWEQHTQVSSRTEVLRQ